MFSVTAWHDGIVVMSMLLILLFSSAAADLLLWQLGWVKGQLQKSDLLGFCCCGSTRRGEKGDPIAPLGCAVA